VVESDPALGLIVQQNPTFRAAADSKKKAAGRWARRLIDRANSVSR
jgi:hypothetical protein